MRKTGSVINFLTDDLTIWFALMYRYHWYYRYYYTGTPYWYFTFRYRILKWYILYSYTTMKNIPKSPQTIDWEKLFFLQRLQGCYINPCGDDATWVTNAFHTKGELCRWDLRFVYVKPLYLFQDRFDVRERRVKWEPMQFAGLLVLSEHARVLVIGKRDVWLEAAPFVLHCQQCLLQLSLQDGLLCHRLVAAPFTKLFLDCLVDLALQTFQELRVWWGVL